MTAPFVTTLRSRAQTIRVGNATANVVTLRVEIPELWDVVRVETSLGEPVLAVKNAALAVLVPKADQRAFVIKLRGFEVMNESASLADAGAQDGSIFLLTHRRRRPVK